MSKNFWGAFSDTLIKAGFHPFEIRQQARAFELLRTFGIYADTYE